MIVFSMSELIYPLYIITDKLFVTVYAILIVFDKKISSKNIH